MPRIDEIVLDAAKGQPAVEVIFGQAHVGNYRVFLWDAGGKNPRELARGTSADDVADTFPIAVAAPTLNKCVLSFEGLVQAAEPRAGNVYSVTVTVRQDGTVCPGGVIQEAGAFEDVKALVAFRRFRTA